MLVTPRRPRPVSQPPQRSAIHVHMDTQLMPLLSQRSIRLAHLAAVLLLASSGCADSAREVPVAGHSAEAVADPHAGHDDEHAHDTGPRGGTLVELGHEEFHGELVLRDDGRLQVYLLDEQASAKIATAAAEPRINVVHGGQVQQFRLAEKPQRTDQPGTCSRFELASAELISWLTANQTSARLAISIHGTPYNGSIPRLIAPAATLSPPVATPPANLPAE